MHTRQILYFGGQATVVCDGRCDKAWGVNNRPKVKFDDKDPDDFAYLSDDELGQAPADPGTYEGGHAKPAGPEGMNKWCTRECERASVIPTGDPLELRDLSTRLYNQPWKHPSA